MATGSFGAYILHPWIVVPLQTAMLNIPLAAFSKFAIVSLLGTVASFAVANLAGKVPGIGAALGATSGHQEPLHSEAK